VLSPDRDIVRNAERTAHTGVSNFVQSESLQVYTLPTIGYGCVLVFT